MTIILSDYTVPEQGKVKIDFNFSFEIKYTAVQAKRIVTSWVLNDISYLIGADMPTLVLQAQPVWRTPIWITLAGTNHKEIITTVDVDVATGEIINLADTKAKIKSYLQQNPELSPTGQHNIVKKLPQAYMYNPHFAKRVQVQDFAKEIIEGITDVSA